MILFYMCDVCIDVDLRDVVCTITNDCTLYSVYFRVEELRSSIIDIVDNDVMQYSNFFLKQFFQGDV
jgi:hypothetical protein